jgi:predicted porin
MKMKNVAIAVAALVGSQAFAAEVYNSDGTALSIGGHVSVNLNGSDQGETEIGSNSPRINIVGLQDIGNGFVVEAKGEWGLNFLDGGDQSFTTRLGYLGLAHEEYGLFVAGTQWAPYYDVAGVADLPIAYGNDFLYENQGNLGTARADKMLSYRKTFELGQDLAVNLGLGWQGKHDGAIPIDGPLDLLGEYHSRAQIALSTEIAGFGLGYAYSGGDISVVSSENATSHIVSANYGEYGSGLYAALVYGMNKYFYEGYEKTRQLEGLLAYGVNDWNFSVNYESVDDHSDSKTLYSHSALQAEYAFTSSLFSYAGYQFDLGNDKNKPDNDMWTLGARYYF